MFYTTSRLFSGNRRKTDTFSRLPHATKYWILWAVVCSSLCMYVSLHNTFIRKKCTFEYEINTLLHIMRDLVRYWTLWHCKNSIMGNKQTVLTDEILEHYVVSTAENIWNNNIEMISITSIKLLYAIFVILFLPYFQDCTFLSKQEILR